MRRLEATMYRRRNKLLPQLDSQFICYSFLNYGLDHGTMWLQVRLQMAMASPCVLFMCMRSAASLTPNMTARKSTSSVFCQSVLLEFRKLPAEHVSPCQVSLLPTNVMKHMQSAHAGMHVPCLFTICHVPCNALASPMPAFSTAMSSAPKWSACCLNTASCILQQRRARSVLHSYTGTRSFAWKARAPERRPAQYY